MRAFKAMMADHPMNPRKPLHSQIRIGPGAEGIERMEARFQGRAFAPHRHDTYAIGLTTAGVQSFRFRGAQWHCLPGQCHILHPDELHDGAAGTHEAFGYRMLYVDPALVQAVLAGRALPFVATPVIEAARLSAAGTAGLWDIDGDIDELRRAELAVALAALLCEAAGAAPIKPAALALPALARVRDCLAAQPAERHSMDALERLSGLDRWTIARQFRAAFGTSPTRFRTLRQLDAVRLAIQGGLGLADAALAAGFADQSHMTRQFKRAYGLTPAAWAAALDCSSALRASSARSTATMSSAP
jgi:AraC-like DNA-binding protein